MINVVFDLAEFQALLVNNYRRSTDRRSRSGMPLRHVTFGVQIVGWAWGDSLCIAE
jgi:hypothetical protein